MALTLTYNGKENCYLKAVPTTLSEFYVDDVKTFSTYVIYSISESKGMDPFFRDGFEMEFTPDSSIYVQVYEHMKTLFPESKEA